VLSECDDALYAHDAKLHSCKLKQRGFAFPLRLLLALICKEMSRGEARVFVLRRSQYISLTYFGISTEHSQCAHMSSFTDKLNALKTDIHLNLSTENSVVTSQKTQRICITKTTWSITPMFRKMIVTYSHNYFVHINFVAKCQES
jgi:hypothetical protein